MLKVFWVTIYMLSYQHVIYANEFTDAKKSEYDSQPNTPSTKKENIDQFTTGMPPPINKTKTKVNLTQLDEEKLRKISLGEYNLPSVTPTENISTSKADDNANAHSQLDHYRDIQRPPSRTLPEMRSNQINEYLTLE